MSMIQFFRQSLLLLCFFVGLASTNLAQNQPYFVFFQQEYFFGLHPSARVEAMGKTDVALGGSGTAFYRNPAGLSTIDEAEITLSTSGPYYALTNSDYYFASYSKRISKLLIAQLSLHRFGVGASSFNIDIQGIDFPLESPTINDLALTLAATPINGLHVGINAHLFNWKIFEDVSAARTLYVDAGVLYRLALTDQSALQFGGSVVNVGYADISFESPTGLSSSNVFPVIGRVGIAYTGEGTVDFPGGGEQALAWTLTTEVQDLFNSDYRNTFQLGGEVVLAQALAFRMGYITQSENDFGVPNNRDRFHDWTYGFGIILPTQKWFGSQFPFQTHLDYYSLENPPVVFSGTRRPNKRGFTLRLVHVIPSPSTSTP